MASTAVAVVAVYVAGLSFLLSTATVLVALHAGVFAGAAEEFGNIRRLVFPPKATAAKEADGDTIVLSVGRYDPEAVFVVLAGSDVPGLLVPPDPFVFPDKLFTRTSSVAEIAEAGMQVPEYLEAAWFAGFRKLVVLHRSYIRVLIEEAKIDELANNGANDPCNPITLQFPSERSAVFDTLDKMLRDAFVSSPFEEPLELSFERHVRQDPSVAARMISDWIFGAQEPASGIGELPAGTVWSDLDRCAVLDVVANKPDLHRHLDGTKWEWMLETDPEEPRKSPRELVGA